MKYLSYLFKLYIYICLFVNESNARNKSKLLNYKLLRETYDRTPFNKSTRTRLSHIKYNNSAENVYTRAIPYPNNSRSVDENSQESLINKFNNSRNTLTSLGAHDSSTEYTENIGKGEKDKTKRKKSVYNSNGIDICLTEDNSDENGFGKLHEDDIDHHMNSSSFKVVSLPPRTSSRVTVTSISKKYSDFLVFEAHSQIEGIVLSYVRKPRKECYVNNTNVALVLLVDKSNGSSYSDRTVYLSNFHHHSLSVLLIVRNYTNKEPLPGGLFAINSTLSFPHPYLNVEQNLLTTTISFPLTSLFNITEDSYSVTIAGTDPVPFTPSTSVVYRIYLSYLYEGDLFEDHYRDLILKTSTVEGLEKNSTLVLEMNERTFENDSIEELFVSYSGVGTVVIVVASFNGSAGVRYSSSVFYGCDFIDEAKYNCTKLVSSFAKLFCASLLFIGVILMLAGHRWLNFTMFISGFLASWFLLFVTFVQIPNPDVEVLGILTMFGAIFGGSVWLFLWHRFHRPFYSALLIILICSLLAAMISTHFLKYAIVPTPDNIIAFVLIPVAFSVAIIGYSLFDIKKVHIMSCCLIGSYGVVMPFAFYFGSSLTYIVINVVSLMSVKQYSQAIGFPPFQRCDIILLCIWILIFILGVCLQVYRERFGPPFYPPNIGSLSVCLTAFHLCRDKVKELCGCCSCCRIRSDNDSLFEDRPASSSRLWSSIFPCRKNGDRPQREFFSAYESFPRIGSDDDDHSVREAIANSFRKAVAFIRQAWGYLRQKISGEEVPRGDRRPQGEDDIEPLDNCINNRESEIEENVANRIQ